MDNLSIFHIDNFFVHIMYRNISICNIDCKRVGLVTACHNEINDGVAELVGKAFTPSHVRDDPLIFAGCSVKRPKANQARTKSTIVPDDKPPLEDT